MINNLENIKIKIIDFLTSRNQLKYLDYKVNFLHNQVIFDFRNGIFLGYKQNLFVYYDEAMYLNYATKKYLNYETTYREFENFDDAINFVKYIEQLTEYQQLEQSFYFENKARKLEIYNEYSLKITGNLVDDDFFSRIDIYGLNFSIKICFGASYVFDLLCYPNIPNFSKNKRKTYNSIDDLFSDLEKFSTSYDSIIIDETARDMF